MSRVFDALTKASKENKEKIAGFERNQGPLEKRDLGDEGESFGWHWDGNDGSSARPLPGLPPGPKSRRERAEELLLGWDLRPYRRYPIVALGKDSPAAEQYKIFREQVKGLRRQTGVRCLSVTSPVKQDGKTVVSVNLAGAMALEYKEPVLLIDGDLRSPDVHRYFGVESSPGLADYLSSDSTHGDLMAFVRETFLPGLWIIPAGKASNVSSELPAQLKMRTLLTEIRSRFPSHQIIVDTPPVLPTPDPLVLAGEVDGIIMVIRAKETSEDYLSKAIQSLDPNKVMGIVLNGADIGMASKYYYPKYSKDGDES